MLLLRCVCCVVVIASRICALARSKLRSALSAVRLLPIAISLAPRSRLAGLIHLVCSIVGLDVRWPLCHPKRGRDAADGTASCDNDGNSCSSHSASHLNADDVVAVVVFVVVVVINFACFALLWFYFISFHSIHVFFFIVFDFLFFFSYIQFICCL